jgi:hypothetical protein
MTNLQWIALLQQFPSHMVNQLVLLMITGQELVVESFIRFEPEYLVMRGRFGGNTDEGRGFFLPYSQLVTVRIERTVTINEIQDIFNSTTAVSPAPVLFPSRSAIIPPDSSKSAGNVSADKVNPLTQSGLIRNQLLERLRAARQAPTPTSRSNQEG